MAGLPRTHEVRELVLIADGMNMPTFTLDMNSETGTRGQ